MAVDRGHFLYAKIKLEKRLSLRNNTYLPSLRPPAPTLLFWLLCETQRNKKRLCITGRKGFTETQNNISLPLPPPPIAFNTPGGYKPGVGRGGGSEEISAKFKQQIKEEPSHLQNSKTWTFSSLRSNKKTPVPCSRPLQGSPFFWAGWLFPLAHAGSSSRCSINNTDFHPPLSKRRGLVLHRRGICQFRLCANLALLGVSRLHQSRKRISFPFCILWRWPETIIKNEQRDYKLICPHWLLWLQRYDYKPRICKRPQFLINLHYRFYHCLFF